MRMETEEPSSSLEVATAVAEGVLKQNGTKFCDFDLASRKEELAANNRYEATRWLRKMVGFVGSRDLPEEPSEEEFRLGLRNGIVLCNALNKVQPGAVPKIVGASTDGTLLPDGSALTVFQYFENLRNFLVAIEELGLPTFEASDLERGGKGSRVVNSILALKSYSEHKKPGRNGFSKYGGIIKPTTTGKPFIRKNSEPFMNSLFRSRSLDKMQENTPEEQNLSLEFLLEPSEMMTSHSINMLVTSILSNKKPEEVPLIVGSLLSKVMQEFERRIECQNEFVKTSKDLFDETQSCGETISTSSFVEASSTCTSAEAKFDTTSEDSSDVSQSSNETSSITDISSTSTWSEVQSQKEESFTCEKEECEKEEFNLSIKYQEELKQKFLKQKLLKQQLLFDKQNTEVQELKEALKDTRISMESVKLQYSKEFNNLGKQLNVLVHAASGYHRVLEENRKLYNQVQDLKGNIRVYCRVRPFLPGQSSSSTAVAHMDDGSITVHSSGKNGKEGQKTFQFNKVFGSSATQEDIFADTRPLIRSVLDGYNVCIFAYGQTGSGKTHTMTGPKELNEQTVGVNYRALNDLFLIAEQRKETAKYNIAVQMIEIYNEQVRDLLSNDANKKLEIRNNSQSGTNLPDAVTISVTSTSQVIELMDLGHKNRAVSSTAMNDRSSRSHSCLTIHVHGKELTSGTALKGCLHLVDLAGSERVNKSEVKGVGLKEAQHINKSLAALGDVISALAQKSSHVPYRNSKLTQLLQDSLGGQAKTLMFVHMSPEVDAIGETLSTLKFAERVATVELGKAKQNKDNSEVKVLKEQIASLRAALASKEGEYEHMPSTMSSPDRQMEDVSNIQVRSNSEQKEMVSGEWVDKLVLNKLDASMRNGDRLADWEGGDNMQGQHLSPNSITDDSDDLDFAASEYLEPDMSWQLTTKTTNTVNGVSRVKKTQNSAKIPDTRTTSLSRVPAPSRKVHPGPTPTKNSKQPISTEGKLANRAKIGTGK